MNIKGMLNEIINNDTTNNKCSTKYMYKNHPDVWAEVIRLTAFLPEDAKPKQRVWHILNDVWKVPLCPETGDEVKWFENRYLTFKNSRAKMLAQHKRGDFKDSYSPEITEKRATSNRGRTVANGLRKAPDLSDEVKASRLQKARRTCLEKYGVDVALKDPATIEMIAKKRRETCLEKYGVPYPVKSPETIAQAVEKSKQTCMEKYGVPHPSKVPEIKEKQYQTRIDRGHLLPRETKPAKEQYYLDVEYYTRRSWLAHFYDINPHNLPRNYEMHLDHVFSRLEGFIQGIPPFVIGHWTNLHLIPREENISKLDRCDKTKDQLFEDFLHHTFG